MKIIELKPIDRFTGSAVRCGPAWPLVARRGSAWLGVALCGPTLGEKPRVATGLDGGERGFSPHLRVFCRENPPFFFSFFLLLFVVVVSFIFSPHQSRNKSIRIPLIKKKKNPPRKSVPILLNDSHGKSPKNFVTS